VDYKSVSSNKLVVADYMQSNDELNKLDDASSSFSRENSNYNEFAQARLDSLFLNDRIHSID